MPKTSAGLLMYRLVGDELQFLLAHPGGPFFKNKDLGAWTILKGEIAEDEGPLQTACREFEEETGIKPSGGFIKLTPIKQKGGKIVQAWAFEGDCDPTAFVSNTFQMEWPPRSGRQQEFSEVDRVEWFNLEIASQKINQKQVAFLEEVSRQESKE